MASRILHLPDCCATSPLALPRPDTLSQAASMVPEHNAGWESGLDSWRLVTVGYWHHEEQVLTEAISAHLNRTVTFDEAVDVLSEHGLKRDGTQGAFALAHVSAAVLRGLNDMAAAMGRDMLASGMQMWEAAEDFSDSMSNTVWPVVKDANEDEEEFWSPEVITQWDLEARCAHDLLVINSVHTAALVRGHGVGAWSAAATVALLSGGQHMLVAMQAAPLHPADAVPGLAPDAHGDLTEAEQAALSAAGQRLAEYWRECLGLRPLPSRPEVLTYAVGAHNAALRATLAAYSA